jgi:hypothetical protein
MALLGLVLMIGRIIVTEYREQGLLVEKTPVSPYHSRSPLPEKLDGSILIADLKNSELLARVGAAEGDAGKYVNQCLSHMWTAVLEAQGIILATEGDQLLAFFDGAAFPTPVLAALGATEGIMRNLRLLEERFRPLEVQLDFRAAITVGAIRPVWQEMGKLRQPSWIEAGSTNALVECARLMELERQVNAPGRRTLVILPQSQLAPVLGTSPELREKVLFEQQTRASKHSTIYTFAVYAPGRKPPAPAPEAAAAAADASAA